MAFICAASSIPGRFLPKSGLLHTLAHLFEYTILGALWMNGLTRLRPHANIHKMALFAAAAIFLFSAMDEWHQSFVPGRKSKPETVVSNTVYALCGVYFYAIRRRHLFRTKKHPHAHSSKNKKHSS